MIKKYKRALRLFVSQHYSYRHFKDVVGTEYEFRIKCEKTKYKRIPRYIYRQLICECRSLRRKYKEMYKNNIGRSK